MWSSNKYFLENLFSEIPQTWQTDILLKTSICVNSELMLHKQFLLIYLEIGKLVLGHYAYAPPQSASGGK